MSYICSTYGCEINAPEHTSKNDKCPMCSKNHCTVAPRAEEQPKKTEKTESESKKTESASKKSTKTRTKK